MNEPTVESLFKVAFSSAEKASHFIQEESTKVRQINYKSITDPVTQADRGSEKIILAEITRHFPDHGILTEESQGKGGQSSYTWIIDPLDGTTNFVHGYPFYAVSIAVYQNNLPLIGVIADVYHQQLYSAISGRGAFLNGEPIRVSKTQKLRSSLLATGFPYIHDELWASNFNYLKTFTDVTQGVRRAGAAAIDLAHVARGWLDGFWEVGLKPWDTAAGILIVEEANGKISRMDGSKFSIFDQEIVASNGSIHSSMLKIIQKTRRNLGVSPVQN